MLIESCLEEFALKSVLRLRGAGRASAGTRFQKTLAKTVATFDLDEESEGKDKDGPPDEEAREDVSDKTTRTESKRLLQPAEPKTRAERLALLAGDTESEPKENKSNLIVKHVKELRTSCPRHRSVVAVRAPKVSLDNRMRVRRARHVEERQSLHGWHSG